MPLPKGHAASARSPFIVLSTGGSQCQPLAQKKLRRAGIQQAGISAPSLVYAQNNLPPAPNPDTKGERSPNPATERPLHSPSTASKMQLTSVAYMLAQGRRGIYTSTWQPGINLGKAVAMSSPPLTSARAQLLPSILQCQHDLCKKNHCFQSTVQQKVTIQAICTENPKFGTFSPWYCLG